MAVQRITLLDNARVLTALLVVVGHLLVGRHFERTLYIYIYQFHMPLFFFISGMLDRHTAFAPYIKKNARLLLIPLVSFSLLLLLERVLRYGWHGYLPMLRRSGEALLTSGVIDVSPTIWFLIVLFEAKLLSVVFERAGWLASAMLWVGLLVATYYFNPLFMASTAMIMPLYLAGYYGREYVLRLSQKPWFPFLWPVAFALVAVIMSYNGRVSTNAAWYGHATHGLQPLRILCFYTSAMSGILGVLSLSSLTQKHRAWVQTSAEALITIMFLQYLVIRLCSPILFPSSLPFRLFAAVVIMVVCVIVHQLIARYAPFMLGRGYARKTKR